MLDENDSQRINKNSRLIWVAIFDNSFQDHLTLANINVIIATLSGIVVT